MVEQTTLTRNKSSQREERLGSRFAGDVTCSLSFLNESPSTATPFMLSLILNVPNCCTSQESGDDSPLRCSIEGQPAGCRSMSSNHGGKKLQGKPPPIALKGTGLYRSVKKELELAAMIQLERVVEHPNYCQREFVALGFRTCLLLRFKRKFQLLHNTWNFFSGNQLTELVAYSAVEQSLWECWRTNVKHFGIG